MPSQVNSNKKTLVIIGGGFAGAKLAAEIEKKIPSDWTIYLLSKTNFVTFNPLLPEVVGASVLPGHVQAPIRQMVTRTRVRMVTVDRIDLKQRKVFYHNNEPGELAFDQLIFASGVAANMTMIEGLEQHALPLKTVGDALYIRNRVVERLEQATIHPDPIRRKALTSFIVIGGGFSGVEVAGELEDFLNAAVRYYKNVAREDCKIILLHAQDRLLPELSKKLGKKVEQIFGGRNIDVRLNATASKIEDGRVLLKDGEVIAGETIICTIGTAPHDFIQNDCLPRDRGKIIVGPDMSVQGQGLSGVWALGDCALVPNAYDGKHSPPTAQFADRQAKVLAKNIVAKLSNKNTEPFCYKPAGMLASIGRNKAVAEIFGVQFSGLIAFFMWRSIYLLKVPTLSRKIRLFLEWSWTMIFPPDISHLGFKRTSEK